MPDIDRSKPHVTVDTESDAAYIYLAGRGKSARTVEATKDIYLDLDKEGRVIGIELLDLKLLHPSIGPVLDITSKRPRRRRKEMAL
jgi:uncharacterized protein YuzE